MKKWILTLAFCIFLISSVSAWEWDNVKSYDAQTKTATITNALGLGSKIADITLNTPEIVYIHPNNNVKVAEFTINSYNNYDSFKEVLKQIKFYNLITEKEQQKQFTYKYLKNNNWVELNLIDSFPKQEITIGIFTDVHAGEMIEWVPTMYGKEIEEWASWVGYVRGEYYNVNDDNKNSIINNQQIAQTFTIGNVGSNSNFEIRGVNVKVEPSGNPTDMQIHICAVNATNGPDSSDCLALNRTLDETQVTGTGWWNISLASPYTTTAGETYALIMNNSQAVDKFFWYVDTAASTYGGGSRWVSTDNIAWENSSQDMMFEIWGVTNEIALQNPKNNTRFIQTNLNFTFNISLFNLTNASFNIWYSNGSLFNQSVRNISGNFNSTTLQVNSFDYGNYKWGAKSCGQGASASCFSNSDNYSFSVGSKVNDVYYNRTAFETETQGFIANITTSSGQTPTTGILWYNGTEYSATITNVVGDNYTIERNLDIPPNTGNNSFYFKWDIGSVTLTTDTYSHNISLTNWTKCNAASSLTFLNLTFKDESTGNWMNSTIDSSSWVYYLGTGGENKTYSYSTSANHSNYSFCLVPTTRNVTIKESIRYSYGISYPQRRYDAIEDFSNVTTHKTIYLLPSTDGLYVTFQVLSGADQPISGVYANVTRKISGTDTIVGAGYTGADGGITFWLDPNYEHTFAFAKTGYDTYVTTITPSQSQYTIYLGGGTETGDLIDYSQGISARIQPEQHTLFNQTIYGFNLTLNSTYYDLEEFGFSLFNGSGTFIGRNSSTVATGGKLNYIMNTALNTSLYMEYYWVVNGNYSNLTRRWGVMEINDEGFGLSKFFTDLKTYTDEEIFGLTPFARTIIIFIIIFIIIGIMSYTSGIYSPAAITWMLFVLVGFFDYVLGLILNPIGAVPHFPTLFILLMAIGLTIREAMK